MFFGVAHGREQLLQLLIFHGGQMPVGIHRQNQQIEEGLLLGGRKISQINFHGKSLPEVEADFNRRRSVSGPAGRKKHRRNNCEMRLLPNVGSACLSSMIFSVIGAGSLAGRDFV
jgi:hypothetical protein